MRREQGCWVMVMAAYVLALATARVQATPAVGLLMVDGAIGRASADYIVRGIARAAEKRQQLLVIRLDTPGGLDTSMRSAIKAILTSPVPVAVYVAPGGARAASAGTYLLYANHIAAMAPGTNLGAATAVELGIGGQPPEQARPPQAQPPPARAPGNAGKAPQEAGAAGAAKPSAGMYALQMLPVNYAGLALIALGLMFMGAEAFLPSFGILGLGGIVAFVAGGLMLIDTELPGYGIPPVLIGTLAIASALLLAGTARLALATRRRPVTSGAAGMIGAVATVENVAARDRHAGWVRIEGELWHAVSAAPLGEAHAVKVVGRKGLTLEVVPVDNKGMSR